MIKTPIECKRYGILSISLSICASVIVYLYTSIVAEGCSLQASNKLSKDLTKLS